MSNWSSRLSQQYHLNFPADVVAPSLDSSRISHFTWPRKVCGGEAALRFQAISGFVWATGSPVTEALE
jgi:hypothetical protein